MIVHSVLFGDNANYQRMARVLEYSIGLNSPKTPFRLHRITEPDGDLVEAINKRRNKTDRKALYLNNARKTKHHCKIVQEARDGEILCLMDADAFVLRDLTPAKQFRSKNVDSFPEIVVTQRPAASSYPVNTGVVLVKISEFTKSFFRYWLAYVIQMLEDKRLHNEWRAKFGGINQAALAALDADYPGANIVRVPCRIWNCEGECLKRGLATDETRVVHVMSILRRHLFYGEQTDNQQVLALAEKWRGYEKAAMGVAA